MTTKRILINSLAILLVTILTCSCKKNKATPPQTLTVSTFAGNGTYGNVDGTASTAQFATVLGLTADAQGNIYVTSGHAIKKITAAGQVSTLAGMYNQSGFTDGTGTLARFNSPVGLAADGAGNVFVADDNNNSIRKISPAGVVTTIAGGGIAGNTNGNGTVARFNNPMDVAIDASGNLIIADYTNNRIRKIDQSGNVSTYAGNFMGYADGTVGTALFSGPYGVATDKQGNVFVSDRYNNRIRKISNSGVVTTVAGSGNAGLTDGPAASATFSTVVGIKVTDNGDIYVADRENFCIRKISGGQVSTYAGSGIQGYVEGNPFTAQFKFPWGIAFYGNTLYVADGNNFRIRQVGFQ
ncbi:MAG: hypothetical protein JST86_13845 [Bacteroidetes bacterium]|nr:hypothetical protein [Bacteroidota bacterium]